MEKVNWIRSYCDGDVEIKMKNPDSKVCGGDKARCTLCGAIGYVSVYNSDHFDIQWVSREEKTDARKPIELECKIDRSLDQPKLRPVSYHWRDNSTFCVHGKPIHEDCYLCREYISSLTKKKESNK